MKTVLYEGYEEPGLPKIRYRYVKDWSWPIGYGFTVHREVEKNGRKKIRHTVCMNQYWIR